MRRLSIESGANLDELLVAARAVLAKNPKFTPEQVDKTLRANR